MDQTLPAEANAWPWWSDARGWDDFPAADVCETAGWRLEAVRVDVRLVRLARVDEAPAGQRPSTE